MSYLHYYISEDGISFAERRESVYVSKKEMLDFIEYLRNKDEVIIDRRIVRGLFCATDITYISINTLKIMKEADSTEDAYNQLKKHYYGNNQNCNHKSMPQLKFIYFDELLDFLKENNVQNAEKVAEIISRGLYKQEYIRYNRKILSDDFNNWAKGCKWLPRRNRLFNEFRSEYSNYMMMGNIKS